MRRRSIPLFAAACLLTAACLLAAGCADPEPAGTSGDAGEADAGADTTSDVTAASDTADAGGAPDATPADTGPSLHAIDHKPLQLLDQMWAAMAKQNIWPGYPLATVPILLLHREKGSEHGLMVRWPKAPEGASKLSVDDVDVDVWWTEDHLDVLLPAQDVSGSVSIGDQLARVAAVCKTAFKPGWEWPAMVAKAAFVRMQEVEQAWAAVEGCGLARYPRKQELIELTLLEDALLGEILVAKEATLPDLARDLLAVRGRRIEVAPYTQRIDNDAEHVNGAPRFAELMVPVRAEIRDADEVRDLLADELGQSMKVPLADLDDQLMWQRPLTSGVVMLQMAARLGWQVQTTFKAGKSVYEVAVKELGAPDSKRIDGVKARHAFDTMAARAAELMKL